MSAIEKINVFFDRLPFKGLAEKIPTGARAKVPLLEKAIPFANYIATGLAVVLVIVVIAAVSGGGGSSGGGKGGGGSKSFGTGKLGTIEASASDFIYELNKAGDGVVITGYKGKGGDLVIPSVIEEYPVVAFRADSLSGFSPPINIKFDEKGNIDLRNTSLDYDKAAIITSVVFPDSITSFSDWNKDSGYSHTNAFNGQPVKFVANLPRLIFRQRM